MSELSVGNVQFNLLISCKLCKLYDKLGYQDKSSANKRETWDKKLKVNCMLCMLCQAED